MNRIASTVVFSIVALLVLSGAAPAQEKVLAAVTAGFCAQSALATGQGEKGCYYTIAEAPPVMMTATILTRTEQRDAAERFAAFLLSHEAGRMKEAWGFQ